LKSYDYIIVGAGSAGCVLANRLSEDPKIEVCLLEAGAPAHSPIFTVPLGVMAALNHRTNWKFSTAPQAALKNREIYTPRGKTLGGTSMINGMVYLRGLPEDYNEWSSLGNTGWSWDDVLPYFLKSENNENFRDDPLHNTDGLMSVRFLNKANPITERYLEASQSLQHKLVEDLNGADPNGVGYFQSTTTKGRRASTSRAFLKPARNRKNLTVLTRSPVSRLIMEGNRAAGVVVQSDGPEQKIHASREVILSAGSYLSPKILMLSGIGDRAELNAHSIASTHHLPGVGKNLQDHPSCPFFYKSKSRVPYGISLPVLPRLLWNGIEYALRRQGLLASNIMECGGLFKTDPAKSRPDIQHIFMPGYRQPPPNMIGYGHGYSLNIILLRPESRGEVCLAGSDPKLLPIIDPKHLENDADMETLATAYKKGRRILSNLAFDALQAEEVLPGPSVQSDEDLIDFIRGNAATIFHPVGTCKMGADDDSTAVLDPRLKVRGINGLRVADASIMPRIIGGNTNAPTIMIAEKAADMIKQDAQAR